MKFNFKFSNLLGTVYSKGNLEFTPDGDSIISPVGNRVSIFDLKNNKSETLPIESKFNITTIAISPDGWLLLLVNEEGECLLCNTHSKSIIHRYYFARPIRAIKFSPDGKKFAVCKEDKILLFFTPGRSKEFNPFVLKHTFYGSYDDTVCIDWTSDSRVLIAGSRDMSSRVHATERFKNLICYVLGGHNEAIVGCFFEKNSLNAYTVSRNGRLNVWECDTPLNGLLEKTKNEEENDEEIKEDVLEDKKSKNKIAIDDDDDDDDLPEDDIKKIGITYKKKSKFGIRDALEASTPVGLLSCDYNKFNRILVSGFSNGAFLLHELPDFNLIHSLKISDQPITSCLFNKTGDWIAIACEGLGQLLVWEWQSETYVLKQQGHFNNMTQLAYSPSGQHIASGGEDGKIKVWNTLNNQCFVTFSEHNAAVTGIQFKTNGQVIISSSLDGTCRAFDLNRYRNFRTFTSPQPVQFSCLSIDPSGEFVCAGGFDVFDIFVWSMQTGHLLEVLSGHEGPVSSIAFSPNGARPLLASGSWDKTCKIWDVFEGKSSRESYILQTDVLAVSFKPDGKVVACSTLDAQITFIDINEDDQHAVVGNIECKHDLGYSRKDTDKITAKKSQFGKAFKSLCFTTDGEYLIAGGKSKYICIYSAKEQILVKRFEISCNKSFDGIDEFLDRRKMTEFGSLSLVEKEDDANKIAISLPGVVKGDHSSRSFKPEIQVTCVRFSPTARSWCACSTEGLLMYSIDSSLIFDPFDLDIEITPKQIRDTLFVHKEYSVAIMQAFRLNEEALCSLVLETIPHETIDVIVESLPDVYVDKLLSFISNRLEKSPHLEFYLLWAQAIISKHANRLKQRSMANMGVLCNLEKSLTKKYEDLGKICDSNRYSIEYILTLSRFNTKNKKNSENEDEEMDDDDNDDDDVESSDNDEIKVKKNKT